MSTISPLFPDVTRMSARGRAQILHSIVVNPVWTIEYLVARDSIVDETPFRRGFNRAQMEWNSRGQETSNTKMVDFSTRKDLSQDLRRLVTGRMTNDEFDEVAYGRFFDSKDRAVDSIAHF